MSEGEIIPIDIKRKQIEAEKRKELDRRIMDRAKHLVVKPKDDKGEGK